MSQLKSPAYTTSLALGPSVPALARTSWASERSPSVRTRTARLGMLHVEIERRRTVAEGLQIVAPIPLCAVAAVGEIRFAEDRDGVRVVNQSAGDRYRSYSRPWIDIRVVSISSRTVINCSTGLTR